jgi:hypothetical protein
LICVFYNQPYIKVRNYIAGFKNLILAIVY